jgi:hypothetical protein
VTKHIDDKNTRNLGRTREYYDHSMSSHPIRQDLNVLTSTRYDLIGWRGTQASFIAQWTEQARIFNEMGKREVYGQTVDLVLNTCFSNTPNLPKFLPCSTMQPRQRVSNLPRKPSEYVARLVEQAQVLTQLTPAHVTLALLVLTSPNFCSMITSQTHLHTKLM